MSFIAKNPLSAPTISETPPSPPAGARGLFATNDGWYDIDDEGNTNKLATENDVSSEVASLVNSAPETLNTLNELAEALGDDPNFATTVATQLGLKANSADLSDVAFSGSLKDIKDAPMEDLGKFYYVFDINTGEETQTTTSTKYTNYTDALNNTRKTGVYKIELYNQEIENGEVVWNTCESSLLFVSGGIGFNQDEVVHQMIFDNYIDDESSGSIYLPRIRTYSNKTGKYQWSGWTSPWGEAGDWGFETSGNKVREMGDGDESNTISYPSLAAVCKFVNEKIKGLDLGLTEEQLNKINNAIQPISDVPNAGLSFVDHLSIVYDQPDDVMEDFGEDFYYMENYTSNGEYLGDVSFYDATTIARRILALDKKINPTPITTIPTTLTPNQQYNFGEVTELALAFPTVANDGDVIYATFITGETVTTLTIDTTNTCDIEFVPEANTGYEIFGKYNGSIWIVNYSEYTVSEG